MSKDTKELRFVPCSEDYCKSHYLEYRELVKVGNKVEAFITLESLNKGYSYAFGKPSQSSYISFSGKENKLTLEECRNKVYEIINKRINTFSSSGIKTL